MAIRPDFPKSPHSILSPDIRWFLADEALRKKVKEWRDTGYDGASDTSKALFNWWFKTEHLLPRFGC